MVKDLGAQCGAHHLNSVKNSELISPLVTMEVNEPLCLRIVICRRGVATDFYVQVQLLTPPEQHSKQCGSHPEGTASV